MLRSPFTFAIILAIAASLAGCAASGEVSRVEVSLTGDIAPARPEIELGIHATVAVTR